MKSVGEAMAIGRTFKESLQKALRSLEIDSYGFDDKGRGRARRPARRWKRSCASPTRAASGTSPTPTAQGMTHRARSIELSKIDPWFLENIRADRRVRRRAAACSRCAPTSCCAAPSAWASPTSASRSCCGATRGRRAAGAPQRRHPCRSYKMVDTCGAEFDALHAVPLLDLRGRGRERRHARARRS